MRGPKSINTNQTQHTIISSTYIYKRKKPDRSNLANKIKGVVTLKSTQFSNDNVFFFHCVSHFCGALASSYN